MMINPRLELLSELEQTPEEYIPELLRLVRTRLQSTATGLMVRERR